MILKCIDYYHTPHVLQPLEIELYINRSMLTFMWQPRYTCLIFHKRPPTDAISEGRFVYHGVRSKIATVGNALKGYQCSGLYPYNPSVLSGDEFLPSTAPVGIQNLSNQQQYHQSSAEIFTASVSPVGSSQKDITFWGKHIKCINTSQKAREEARTPSS
jgi:hypothetical protein